MLYGHVFVFLTWLMQKESDMWQWRWKILGWVNNAVNCQFSADRSFHFSQRKWNEIHVDLHLYQCLHLSPFSRNRVRNVECVLYNPSYTEQFWFMMLWLQTRKQHEKPNCHFIPKPGWHYASWMNYRQDPPAHAFFLLFLEWQRELSLKAKQYKRPAHAIWDTQT